MRSRGSASFRVRERPKGLDRVWVGRERDESPRCDPGLLRTDRLDRLVESRGSARSLAEASRAVSCSSTNLPSRRRKRPGSCVARGTLPFFSTPPLSGRSQKGTDPEPARRRSGGVRLGKRASCRWNTPASWQILLFRWTGCQPRRADRPPRSHSPLGRRRGAPPTTTAAPKGHVRTAIPPFEVEPPGPAAHPLGPRNARDCGEV